MGLTRVRAYQVFDIDYKQAVRVVTKTNVTLTGGAPSTVDGVNLVLNDRILVTGQNTPSQNGIYQISTLGTGSNGTWSRALDANQQGEIQAGMIVMVTEGTVYKDTQWKLTTNDPITLGVTDLFYETNISSYAFSSIIANGASIVANSTIDSVAFSSGNNIVISGNAVSATVNISTVDSPSFSGTLTSGNILTTGIVSASGNVVGGNVNATNYTGTTASLSGNATGGNLLTSGLISATGAITGANITGSNLLTSGIVSATGTGTFGNVSTGGNVSASSLVGNVSGSTVSVTSNITGGNIFTGGEVSATGRIQGANIIGANLLTSGTVSATGNILGNYFIGNGSQLTDIPLSSSIVNGTSNVSVLNNGNVLVNINETANVAVFHANGVRIANTLSALNIDSASADIAEKYLSDEDYPIGTVLVIGGSFEVTQSTSYAQATVVGTVSQQPALTMNRDLQGKYVVELAFLGRVPCRVVGNINRGDMLVSSTTPGVATSMKSYVSGAVLGKALESYNSDAPGVIEIIVGRL